MVSGSIVAQGFELLLYGMGTVLFFLTLLVYATSVMSWCVARLSPAPVEPLEVPASPAAENDTLVAVISAAVRRYRSTRK